MIKKGKVRNKTLVINGKPIPSITEKPVKYLRKGYKVQQDTDGQGAERRDHKRRQEEPEVDKEMQAAREI